MVSLEEEMSNKYDKDFKEVAKLADFELMTLREVKDNPEKIHKFINLLVNTLMMNGNIDYVTETLESMLPIKNKKRILQ